VLGPNPNPDFKPNPNPDSKPRLDKKKAKETLLLAQLHEQTEQVRVRVRGCG
jgi:hypothetical protein